MLPAKVSSYEFHVATLPCKVTSSRIVTLYCGSMTCLVLSGPGIFLFSGLSAPQSLCLTGIL